MVGYLTRPLDFDFRGPDLCGNIRIGFCTVHYEGFFFHGVETPVFEDDLGLFFIYEEFVQYLIRMERELTHLGEMA